eukprot:CAMPEP_0117665278 /NCGR_PEP_ID=MMETSP0804-20121206/9723_1 /TAXON_ID=1074897 /ORGANISM="Tetraselmis astigmatica, Strain CCMP880" /LENGTH=338 /DNA_ID=CAMNT_0005472677 /DNA_START=109 /DNA_END=1125 /DNA_ORIENTATION=+
MARPLAALRPASGRASTAERLLLVAIGFAVVSALDGASSARGTDWEQAYDAGALLRLGSTDSGRGTGETSTKGHGFRGRRLLGKTGQANNKVRSILRHLNILNHNPMFRAISDELREFQKEPLPSVKEECYTRKPIPPFRTREDLGVIMEFEGFKVGAELGVQMGIFAAKTLSRWPSVEEYLLVDLWAQRASYRDDANVNNVEQERRYQTTLSNTNKWKKQRKVCRNLTTECAKQFPDQYFDFIYVDAGHDFKSAYDDITAWWPKLKCGGIIAGHDYVTQRELSVFMPKEDWTTNSDGTKDRTGLLVKGAVDKFAREHGRQLTISYREHHFNTWAMRK